MRFHLCFANHNPMGRQTLLDMADWFECGLLELGHQVSRSDSQLDPNAVNILWEYFLPGFGKAIRDTGVVYGIVATEIPDGDGFNWRRDGEWCQRWQGFSEAAEGADFIWTMVEETVPFYSQFAPTAYMELGFSQALVPLLKPSQREIDFGFWGLATPYRLSVIERLQKYVRVEWPQKLLSTSQLQDFMSHIKIGLSFKQSDQWPVPSPTRLGRLLHARVGIAAERTRVTTRQSALVKTVPDGSDFVDFALELLHGTWKEEAENAFEQYRQKLPMRLIMEEILDKTVSDDIIAGRSNNISGRIKLNLPWQPLLIEMLNNYNILEWKDIYYGIPQSLGSLDITSQDCSQLPEILIAESPELLKIQILQKRLQKLEAHLADSKELELFDSESPQLVKSLQDYNIVAYKNMVFGIPQSLGAIDFSQVDVLSLEGVVTGLSVREVQKEIEILDLVSKNSQLQLEMEQLQSQIQIIESSKFWKLRSLWLRLKNTTK
ncbi:MAG: hypothetical protein DCF19_09590 [Pseudanabaena frigida]|uniref:Uncharacterized protein n=1 Tax=Pseudanabaena frigida TaxID=945775 RepID=A0A2W4W9E9_9CYAN|nr:MAG: hypothetical protein DCF19_09590 [Pseudanabaena frigida]